MAFGVAYTQLPLYSSNQNHHMLAGLAAAGRGWLLNDWQVQTADPFPVFSAVVWFTVRVLHESSFYVFYQGLIAAYVLGTVALVAEVFPACRSSRARLATVAILAALHSEVLGYLLGFDAAHMSWWQMFTWGVAEQEIFGHAMFQGSAFGLLLPVVVLLFVRGRTIAAAGLAALVVVVHPSYLLLAGAIVAGGAAAMARQRRCWSGLAIVALFGGLVAPVLVDVMCRFGPTSASTWNEAAAVLIDHLPVETRPERWFGAKAALQGCLVLAALWRVRRTALAWLLWPACAAGIALTGVQVLTGSAQLALAFPWRVSVLLVPLSSALLVGATLQLAASRGKGPAPQHGEWLPRGVAWLATFVLVALAAGGVVKTTLHFGYFYGVTPITRAADRLLPPRHLQGFAYNLRTDALPMLEFVRQTAGRGDTYLVPLDLERFRMSTGAPVFVDLKTHPYRDVEVLAWRDRLGLARRVLATVPDCTLLSALRRQKAVTHVVGERETPIRACPGVEVIHEDAHFAVLRVRGGA